MADKIRLITHLGISGDLDLNIPNRTTFKLNTYRMSTGQIVGEFEVTEAQFKVIKESTHWKMTYIQLRDEKGISQAADPTNNKVNVGTVINPLGFSGQQVQLIDNALLVKPSAREMLVDNVMDVCKKILDAEQLPPKEAADNGSGEVLPTNEEILAMNQNELKKAFKSLGGKYNTKVDKTANVNVLMDLVELNKA